MKILALAIIGLATVTIMEKRKTSKLEKRVDELEADKRIQEAYNGADTVTIDFEVE